MAASDAETIRSNRLALKAANGLSVAADAFGPPDGPVVLLLHGGGQTRHSWRATASALARDGIYAIAYDLRGHGDSDRSPDGIYGADVHAGDLRAIAGAMERPPILIGASLGGLASLLGCGEPPAIKASGLALVDIAHRSEPEGVKRIRGFMADTVGGFDTIEDAASAVARYLPHRPPPKDLSGLMKNLREGDDGRLYWHWDPAIVANPLPDPDMFQARLTAAARNIDIPTLVVRGAHSEIVAPETADDLQAMLKQAEVVEIAEARHMVAGDNNDPFLMALLDFVRRVAG